MSADVLQAFSSAALAEAIERPSIVYFPSAPLPLPADCAQRLLRDELGRRLTRKNVSYYPSADTRVGLDGDAALSTAAACIEGQHALVDTFIVPLENCRNERSTPFHLLARRAMAQSRA